MFSTKANPLLKMGVSGGEPSNPSYLKDMRDFKRELNSEMKVFSAVCKRLSRSTHGLIGFEDERRLLQDLIQRTATLAESNSLLVIGRRGVGKTKLVDTILMDISDNAMANLMHVKLNGLLQTDDRIALQEITRQLGLESRVAHRTFTSFAENFRFLLDLLRRGDKKSKSVLFVIEEFDLFAEHKNQTLLYNLFDVCQSACTPVCVIGITARLDVVELLEKRVKSRFSHRQVHLTSPCKSFTDYLEVCSELLSLPSPTDAPEVDNRTRSRWNTDVEGLVQNAIALSALKTQYLIRKDIRGLKQLLLLALGNLNEDNAELSATDFIEAVHLMKQDSKANTLRSLSILEICLMVALVKLTDTYDGEPVNFEMVYNEYCRFCRDRWMQKPTKKLTARIAFEQLEVQELICSSNATASTSSYLLRNFRPMHSLVSKAQVTDCFEYYPNCPTEVREWALSEHVHEN